MPPIPCNQIATASITGDAPTTLLTGPAATATDSIRVGPRLSIRGGGFIPHVLTLGSNDLCKTRSAATSEVDEFARCPAIGLPIRSHTTPR